MSGQKPGCGCLPWVIVLVLVGVVAYFIAVPRAPQSINQALRNDYVNISIAANDASQAAATFSRTSSSPFAFTVVIPAGTYIHTASSDEQKLITAQTVTVSFAFGSTSSQTVQIPTYCVDQFADEPSASSSLSINADDNDSYTEETDPIQKLVQYLAGTDASQTLRQLAVWWAQGDYFSLTQSQVQQKLYEAYLEKVRAQGDQELWNQMQKQMSNLSSDDIQRVFDGIKDEKEAKYEAKAQEMATHDVQQFAQYGQQLLTGWNPNIGQTTFFQTAS